MHVIGKIALRLTTLAFLAALAACQRPVTEIELITPVLEVDRAIAERIVALVDGDSNLRISLIPPPSGSQSAVDALQAGYGDVAFAPNNKRYRDDIATIIPLYPSILHIMSRKEKGRPDTLRELLSNATVYAGPLGSTPRLLGEQIVADLDMAHNEVVFVDELGAEADVLLLYAPIDRERVLNDPRLRDLTLFSFGRPQDIGSGSAIDRAVLLNPRLRPFVIPLGTYGAMTPEPVVTLAVDNLLVARDDFDDAAAYDLFAEILRLRPALFGERPELFQPLDENVARSNWTFTLHPGAVAFLQRDEPTFIERYSGVAEVLVTLMIGLISASFAVIRIHNIRRKNRIDEFYTKVIAIRDSIGPVSSVAERNEAIANIRSLQDRGFELVVSENLAADETFRIFVDLTNDSISVIKDVSPG
jgi:TRAP-type uncharacterized transport system substrate-binding protein